MYVDSVGGAENTTPALPPGTQPDHPGAGPGSIPEGFDFEGYGVDGTVVEVWLGDLPTSIEFDWQLRERMEATVRQAEIGGIVPCFFGWQDRYDASHEYLVFLDRIDGAWQTLEAYEVYHGLITSAPDAVQELGGGRLFVGGDLYDRFFPDIEATLTDGVTELGELWRIDEHQIPLQPVLDAIAAIRGESAIHPPTTGSAGLLERD